MTAAAAMAKQALARDDQRSHARTNTDGTGMRVISAIAVIARPVPAQLAGECPRRW